MQEHDGRLLADGGPTPLGARAVQLLAALIAHRHRVVSKGELMAQVWPGAQVREGNLHTQISNLRAVLGEGAIATVPMRGYRFTLPLHDGPERTAVAPGDTAQPREETTAYRFGRHELRPGQRLLLLDDEPVKLGARAYDVLLALVERRVRVVTKTELMDVVWPDAVVEEGNLQTQVSLLRKLVGGHILETIPGRGYRFNAPLLSDQGFAGRDAAASGTAAETTASTSEPVQPPLREPKTNLPPSLAQLFGRDDDLTQLGTMMAEHRLVSIVATGGMGKSRLAQQTLHLNRNGYRHGVCWVELAHVTDTSLLPSAIASALGVPLGTGDDLVNLVGILRDLELLLCLDNVEYVADEVARVAQALHDGAPGTRLLVTSQVPLKLAVERIYRLAPLAIPTADATVADAMRCGAVALFHERASAAERRFRLDANNLGSVVDICRKLDGMPLAIELAAARVPLLGVQALAAALDERLDLLTSGMRGAPQRQKTLRAALEWSLGLLSRDESVVFRRLAVFAGSFSLDMARRVVADPDDALGLSEWDVLDLLGNLVDRSLVVTLDASSPVALPRYRLLESPRALALELLGHHLGEAHALRRRHAQAVMALFMKADEDRWAGRIGVDPGIDLLAPDLENAREAMTWLVVNDPLGAVSMAPAYFYGFTYDRYEDCRRMWEATEAVLRDDMPLDVRAHWSMKLSHFQCDNNPDGRTTRLADFAVRSFRELGDHPRELLARCYHLSTTSARSPGSGEPQKDAIALEQLASAWPMSPVLTYEVNFSLGIGCFNSCDQGDPGFIEAVDKATTYLQRAVEAATRAQNHMGRSMSATGLAYMLQVRGELPAAIEVMQELAKEMDSGRDAFVHAQMSSNLLAAYVELGDLDTAEAVAKQTLRKARPFSIVSDTIDALALLAALRHRASEAALLMGHGDLRYENRGIGRQAVEARMTERARAIAVKDLGEEAFERLRDQGRSLTEEQADRIAVRDRSDAIEPQAARAGSVPRTLTGHAPEPRRGA